MNSKWWVLGLELGPFHLVNIKKLDAFHDPLGKVFGRCPGSEQRTCRSQRERERFQEGEEEAGEEATWPSPSKTCPSMTAYVCVLHRKYIFQGLVSWSIYASALLSANPTLHPSTHPPDGKVGETLVEAHVLLLRQQECEV